MVVLAIVNMLVLLIGFFTGLRKKRPLGKPRNDWRFGRKPGLHRVTH